MQILRESRGYIFAKPQSPWLAPPVLENLFRTLATVKWEDDSNEASNAIRVTGSRPSRPND